jgi:hypothetical protein
MNVIYNPITEVLMGWASHYIEKLKAGETVKFRPHGNSMQPRVESGQLCTVEPLGSPPEASLAPGDVVLCTVEGRQFLHLLSAVKGKRYQISNNKGHVNGWCGINQIHGKLVKVEP